MSKPQIGWFFPESA